MAASLVAIADVLRGIVMAATVVRNETTTVGPADLVAGLAFTVLLAWPAPLVLLGTRFGPVLFGAAAVAVASPAAVLLYWDPLRALVYGAAAVATARRGATRAWVVGLLLVLHAMSYLLVLDDSAAVLPLGIVVGLVATGVMWRFGFGTWRTVAAGVVALVPTIGAYHAMQTEWNCGAVSAACSSRGELVVLSTVAIVATLAVTAFCVLQGRRGPARRGTDNTPLGSTAPVIER